VLAPKVSSAEYTIMSHKPVTTAQTDGLCKVANEKKIGRALFQEAIDNGSFAKFLDSLKVPAKDVTEIRPPEGARIHTVRVKVKHDRPWQEAIDAAGPDTPNDYNVRKVGDLYAPASTEEVEEDLILLNFPKGNGNWDKALAWAQSVGLKNTVPREAFAIGEQHSELHRTLGQNPLYVVATTECTFEGDRRACNVWWDDSGREARLGWVGFFGNSSDWFAFRK
jgi:hypothetical protein